MSELKFILLARRSKRYAQRMEFKVRLLWLNFLNWLNLFCGILKIQLTESSPLDLYSDLFFAECFVLRWLLTQSIHALNKKLRLWNSPMERALWSLIVVSEDYNFFANSVLRPVILTPTNHVDFFQLDHLIFDLILIECLLILFPQFFEQNLWVLTSSLKRYEANIDL